MTGLRHFQHAIELRVRYSETDQMGSYYHSRALEWFECGRTEFLRAAGKPDQQIEAEGLMLPLVEAHVKFLGKARYDDLLRVVSTLTMAGRARFRFDVDVLQAVDGPGRSRRGWTVHAAIDRQGKPVARRSGWSRWRGRRGRNRLPIGARADIGNGSTEWASQGLPGRKSAKSRQFAPQGILA